MDLLTRAVRHALVVSCGVLALSGWLLLTAPAATGAADSGAGWRWPLSPAPVVLARFAAPAGPYAPGHRGADLAALPGAPVLAAGAGVVAFAGRVAGRGVVSIDHPGGLRTTYEPVAAAVARGDAVATGTVLGRLEAGGHCAPATCLHWGLRRGTTYLDPLSLVGSVRVRLLPVWSLPAWSMPAWSMPAWSLPAWSMPAWSLPARSLDAIAPTRPTSAPATVRAGHASTGAPERDHRAPTDALLWTGLGTAGMLAGAAAVSRRWRSGGTEGWP